MAYIVTSRVAWACLVLINFAVGGVGAEENDRNLLNFAVCLLDGGSRVEFVCDLGGSGYVEASNSINIDSSELNLLEEVVVSKHYTRGLGDFVCWREKLDISVPSEVFEDLGFQIQSFLTYRLRSLLEKEGESSPAPTGQINGSDKIRKDKSSVVDLSKEDLEGTSKYETIDSKTEEGKQAKNGSETPSKPEKAPFVDSTSYPPPPKDHESQPPPPPPKEEKEKVKEREVPVDPANQSDQHRGTDDSIYTVCEEGKNLFTRLQTSGDGTQTLTLSLRNDGEGVLDVEIKTPVGLLAVPSRVHLTKGQPAVMVNISVVDRAALADEENIRISSSEGECTVGIVLNVLGNSDSQSYFDRFSMPNMPAVVTPQMRLAALLFILSIVGGLIIRRTWSRWRQRDGAGAGHSYQELEMSLPSTTENATVAYGQGKDDKSGSGDEEGWDEGWDDWEDTEAARSSSRLIPSLSAKGLAARRSNKDGWDSSWDD